jgi:hypothetical protein
MHNRALETGGMKMMMRLISDTETLEIRAIK